MEKQGCGLIKDLLKLYVAGNISGESVSCIEAHSEDCPQCRMAYAAAKRGLTPKEANAAAPEEKPDTATRSRTAIIIAIVLTFPVWLPLLLVLIVLLGAFIACIFVASLVISLVPLAFAATSLFSAGAFIAALFRVDLPAAMVALGASLVSGGLMLVLGIPCLRLCRLMLHLITLIFAAFMRLITGGDVTEG